MTRYGTRRDARRDWQGATPPLPRPPLQAITSAKAAAAAAEEVSAELQRVATVIDAAQARIDSGDLSGALEALRPGLDGSAAAAAADWCAAAEDRVALDDATSLARARAAVLAASVW